ncbi:ISLre2 family transposase [Latilactobacillus curvatus]|uniref:ISLre2 family transposase n=1 Tax=Latilactobacillus curvatus TaxID=28038 RepID=UPI0022430C00|nr:ISLre2 family transposase [Latilactobacillus curvatus]MCW8780797.1 ISLre2 family transposase [Latilactobacillus curvatus]
MNSIIQELMNSALKESFQDLQVLLHGELTFDSLVEQLKQRFLELTSNFLTLELEVADQLLIKTAKQKKWLIHDKREKTIKTLIGPITVNRRYYVNQANEYKYLLDDLLDIESYQRTTTAVESAIIERAAITSYQKTVEQIGLPVGIESKSTVMRILRKYQDFDLVEENTVEPIRHPHRLFIEADEGHLSSQKTNSLLAHLIVIHEGWEQVDNSHRRLINKHVFGGIYTQQTEQLWTNVLDYLDTHYQLDNVPEIIISGDGATWIRQGSTIIPNSIFILDRFHTVQTVRQLSTQLSVPTGTLLSWIAQDKKQPIQTLINQRLEEWGATELSEFKRQSINRLKYYLFTNWLAIQEQKRDNFHGTNMEGQVSHIIADRTSSRPISWSKLGSNIIVHWRVLLANGGNVSTEIQRQKAQYNKVKRIKQVDGRILRRLSHKTEHIAVTIGRFLNENIQFKKINYHN